MKITIAIIFSSISFMCSSQTAKEYFEKGNSKNDLKDYQGAIKEFDKAIEINPKYENAYINRSVSKGQLKDWQGVISDCNKAIEINPNSFQGYNNRGGAKYNLHDNRGAIADLTKAVELMGYPKNEATYLIRGRAKAGLEDYIGSIDDFDKALEINPKYADAYFFRGLSKVLAGQKEGGCLDLSKAGEMGIAKAYEFIKDSCN